jgi:hypothetical protein
LRPDFYCSERSHFFAAEPAKKAYTVMLIPKEIVLELVLIVAPKLFIEPGTKAPFFKLLSVSGPGL